MWRPIETAPRDGTRIDLWITPRVASGRTRGARIPESYFHDGCWLDREGCFVSAETINDERIPTHWMPVPPPPSSP